MVRHFHLHRHRHQPKQEVFKKEGAFSKVGSRHTRVCPNCGCEDFSVIPSRWSWLRGQRNKCSKCGFAFKDPFTEMEYQKARGFKRTRR